MVDGNEWRVIVPSCCIVIYVLQFKNQYYTIFQTIKGRNKDLEFKTQFERRNPKVDLERLVGGGILQLTL